MTLEPCNVCGSLNSDEAEVCLSCGSPTKGSKRPFIFRIAAIALVIVFATPLIITLFGWFKLQLKPRRQTLPPPKVTLFDS